MNDWGYSYPVVKSWSSTPDDGIRISAEAGFVRIEVISEDKQPVVTVRIDPATARDLSNQIQTAADAAALMMSTKK